MDEEHWHGSGGQGTRGGAASGEMCFWHGFAGNICIGRSCIYHPLESRKQISNHPAHIDLEEIQKVKDVSDRSVQYCCILVTPYEIQCTRIDVPLALNSTKAAWTSWSTVRPIVEAGGRSGIKIATRVNQRDWQRCERVSRLSYRTRFLDTVTTQGGVTTITASSLVTK